MFDNLPRGQMSDTNPYYPLCIECENEQKDELRERDF